MSQSDDKFVRRVLIVDDNSAIHADFRKVLTGPANAAQTRDSDELNDLAAALFGSAPSAAKSGSPSLVYEVDSANQGQEGLVKVLAAREQGRPYHVAFVDIRMPPGWDGVETIEQLWKADPELQTVICSAYSDYSWDDIRQRLGDSDRLLILKKPFDTAEICQMAAALSEKHRLAVTAKMKLDELEQRVRERTEALQRSNEQLAIEVEQRRHAEECLRYDVLHDRLTGLPNRALLTDRIEQCIRRQQRDPSYQFAVLFMDMDDFKVVNDSLGHEVGDKLLIGIGHRLSTTIRSLDLAVRVCDSVPSRLGGDEFVVLLDGLKCPEDANVVAERIEKAMAAPFDLDGYEVVTSLSIGIANSSSHYTRAEDILRDADTAVYRAKSCGKRRHAVFDSGMHAQARTRLELEVELRKAVETCAFTLHYQPIVGVATGQIVGFEALARWQHAERGPISPKQFISLAEATGLIVPLGAQVLRLASLQVKQWREQLPDRNDLWVSVNLSGGQLRVADLPDQLDRLLNDAGLGHDALRLEITENLVIQQGDVALETLARLQERKFCLSMDDFGTGHSSLSYLHQLPISSIKIDQSFVSRLAADHSKYSATVQAIVMLAHNCGFKVIAEGVESHEQLAYLQAHRCDLAQGYLFSRPVAPEAATELLRRGTLIPTPDSARRTA